MILLLYALSWLLFGYLIHRNPALIMRPSVWFCLGMMVRVNGAAAFNSVDLIESLNQGGLLRFTTVALPFGVAAWLGISRTLTRTATELYGLCRSADVTGGLWGLQETMILKRAALVSSLILIVYFMFVPLTSSGLFTIFKDPFNAALAREESLKLITFKPIRYGYMWHMEMLAPVMAGLLALWPTPHRSSLSLLKYTAIVAVLLSAMLTGARAPAGLIFMTLALVYLLRKGVHKGVPVLVMSIVSAVLVAAVLSIFRDGRAVDFTPSLLMDYLGGGLFERVFIVPFETGIMTNLFAQENGLLGVANIRPLSLLIGTPYVALPNAVGLAYMHTRVMSISANTSFLFDLQASFGILAGGAASLVVLSCLDWLLLAFRRLRGGLLVVIFATFMTAQHFLTSSALTPCLVTHGLLLIALLARLTGQWLNHKQRAQEQSKEEVPLK